jgi:subtilisin family serine protease
VRRGHRLLAGAIGLLVAPALAPSAAAGAGGELPWIVSVAPGADVEQLDGVPIGPLDVAVEATPSEAASLAARPDVVAVEPDAPAVAAELPDDPCLRGDGCPVSGDQRALRRIGAETAWDVVDDASRVLVAMVDAGVDTSHPDLAGRVTAVPGGPGGCAALDPALGTTDRTARGHGTRVAGIIAAAADGAGIVGVAHGGVRVRAYTALGPDLRGTTSAVAAAIHCAVDDGARVINLSLTAGDTTALRNALDRAAKAGVVVVAAAGNGGDGAHPGPYPAAHPSVIAVTAVSTGTGEERRLANANGGDWVDLAAPGSGIVSTTPGHGWSVGEGTSYAVPFVSGAAALVLAHDPTMGAAAVKARLESTAEPLVDPTVGRGLVDLNAAVRSVTAASPACPSVAAWVLDANGGIRAVGGAPEVSTGALWTWDIARDVVSVPGWYGGYVLDGYGALHPFGGAPAIVSPAYRAGWDVARGADRRGDGSVVVVDAQGGLHVAGDGPAIGPGGPWWPGEDVARDVAVDPTDRTRAYVLDAYGGVHLAGAGDDAPPVRVSRYTPGRDLARRLVVLAGGGRGYVLDRNGRLHPWALDGVALPAALSTATTAAGRDVVVDPATGRLVVVTSGGSVLPAGPAPCRPAPLWSGRDLARGIALVY